MRIFVSSFIIISLSSSLPAVSAPRSNVSGNPSEQPTNALSASEREGIQAVGHGVLMSRRNYRHKPDPTIEALRTEVKATHQLINQLATANAPLLPPSSVATPGQTKASTTTDDDGRAWRTRHASRLARGKQKLAEVRTRIEKARKGKDPEKTSRYAQMPLDLTERMVAIENEIDLAAALPAGQRQEKFRELAASLELEHTAFGRRSGINTPDRPTINTRTGHRVVPSAGMDDKPSKRAHRKSRQ
ncbi:hypothetical protein [Methylomonas methanica]|uniref:LTXXQ motif family protein n=1 Tax=Methylomonas methanica (strain DSM 25384 / MC09) TaxID=857087 RepID=G0A557_METMM|nr:hypothetical protein [Methylomonas methanica]AEG00387.1 hypothetical protein Metme_1974 [Methylomonas methanica MC09]